MKRNQIHLLMAGMSHLIIPLLWMIAKLTRRDLVIRPIAMTAFLLVFCVVPLAVIAFSKNPTLSRAQRILLYVLLSNQIIMWIPAIFWGRGIGQIPYMLGLPFIAIILFRQNTDDALRIVLGCLILLGAAMMVPVIFFSLLFGNIGSIEPFCSVPSPDYSQIATVWDDNQGALGGNTIVDVKQNKPSWDLGIARLAPRAAEIYVGRWGEFYNMTLEWKSEDILLINGKEYAVP